MPCVVQNDITKMRVDAIINAANTSLKMGGRAARHFQAAGARAASRMRCHRRLPNRRSSNYKGYKLPAKYIIHTVVLGRQTERRRAAASCYLTHCNWQRV